MIVAHSKIESVTGSLSTWHNDVALELHDA